MSVHHRRLVVTTAVLTACSTAPRVGRDVAPGETSAVRTARDSALVAGIDAFTRARESMDSLSGVVVLAYGDTPLYARTIGLADRESGAPNRLDTKFGLASVDKFFTRIAIRQLQQAGKLSMNDRVGKHLPEYPNPQVRDGVTIRQLYTMRSGLGDFSRDERDMIARRLTLRSIDDYLALFATDSLQFLPGTKQLYSNAGYVVLGKIIERVSGESYYDYVQRHVFDPAGMRNTGYYTTDRTVPNMAVPYTTSAAAAGGVAPTASPLPQRRPATSLLFYRGSSAGGGYSSAEDLLRLSRALRTHALLSPAYTDSLFELRGPAPFGPDGWAGGWSGGSWGTNTEFFVHSTGHTMVVLSNYDPPSSTVYRTKLWKEWLPAWVSDSAPRP
jgi:CubicO group peptidase (beta-lactamase class C family)